jgi:hypothetical protein
MSLLVGDITELDPSSKSAIEDLVHLFQGSRTIQSIERLFAMEAEVEKLQFQIKEEKRAIAIAFMG